jgi:signal transduction histidine kinase
MGLKTFALVHPDDYSFSKSEFERLLQTEGNGGVAELRYRHKSGHYIVAEVQGNNQLNNPAINGIVLTTRDITSRRQKEEERKQLVFELTEKNADLKQFTFITSHNLRAPLTNLTAICNLFETEELSQEETALFIRAFKISTAKLNETLNDLIQILLIKETRTINAEPVDFNVVLQSIMQSIEISITKAEAVIRTDFSACPSLKVNKAYIVSIFTNLITNAIKYRHPDRRPEIDITTKDEAGYITLTFSDNGIGMNMSAVKHKIFGLYQRFNTSVEGKGLGLYIVQSQVKACGGKITVESLENVGTVFSISLPKAGWYVEKLLLDSTHRDARL